MAEETYKRSRTATTVQLRDNTHKALQPGEPVKVSELSDHMQEQLDDADSWTSKLFEDASQEDYDNHLAGLPIEPPKDFDRDRLNRMSNITLPGPDEVAVVKDGDELAIEKIAASSGPIHHTSSAVVTGGPEEDARLNTDVQFSGGPSPVPGPDEVAPHGQASEDTAVGEGEDTGAGDDVEGQQVGDREVEGPEDKNETTEDDEGKEE